MKNSSINSINSNKFMQNLIEQSNGKMFACTFVKSDGSLRELNGRIGVKKYLKGSKNKPAKDVIVVYDVVNNGYRSIRKDSIVSVRTSGVEVWLNTNLRSYAAK
jgi:hypothetical protein